MRNVVWVFLNLLPSEMQKKNVFLLYYYVYSLMFLKYFIEIANDLHIIHTVSSSFEYLF